MNRLKTALICCMVLATILFAAGNIESPMGVNFWNLYWDGWFQPFLNAMAKAQPFWSQSTDGCNWYDERPLVLDGNGYPTSLQANQSAATLLYPEAAHPVGHVVVTWLSASAAAGREISPTDA